MKLGCELPNEDRALTDTEIDCLRALGAEVVRLRYVRLDVIQQCLEVNHDMVFIVRPPWDGKIEAERWANQLKQGTELIRGLGGRVIINLVNEPNHPDGPYAKEPFESFGIAFKALLALLPSDVDLVLPNLTVMQRDLEWAKALSEIAS